MVSPTTRQDLHSKIRMAVPDVTSSTGKLGLMVASWLESKWFPVAFQPIFNLASGRPLGFEVLGRIPDDLVAKGVPSSPADLVELAHREGWLLQLEHAWRRSAIAIIGACAVDRRTLFFFNVDSRILDDPRFRPGTTHALLTERGLPAHRFVFELTETRALHDLPKVRAVLEHYGNQGFHIALDDVGSGFASLQALVNLRPGIVKLDQDIVRGVSVDSFRRALLEAITGFCRKSRRALIAEGIETPDDLHVLLELGVPFGQGYLLGKPVALPRLEDRLLLEADRCSTALERPGTRLPPCFDCQGIAWNPSVVPAVPFGTHARRTRTAA
jgi:EAL domain-containing protein (putative c-di-GMP-specific phosphodiesterase class I)